MCDDPRHHGRIRIKNTFVEVSDSDTDDCLPGRPSLRESSAPAPEARGGQPRGSHTRGEPPPAGLARGGSAAEEGAGEWPHSAPASRQHSGAGSGAPEGSPASRRAVLQLLKVGSSGAAEGEADDESPHRIQDPLDAGFGGAGAAAAASWPERHVQIEPGAQNGSVHEPLGGQQSLTLGDALRSLMQEDVGCLFLARGVNALGFESEELLTSHYSGYGRVRRVLVVHSKARCWSGGTLSARTRLRPGSMAFVVMEDADVVERIVREVGSEQTVAGKRIRVERFERSTLAESGGASASSG